MRRSGGLQVRCLVCRGPEKTSDMRLHHGAPRWHLGSLYILAPLRVLHAGLRCCLLRKGDCLANANILPWQGMSTLPVPKLAAFTAAVVYNANATLTLM